LNIYEFFDKPEELIGYEIRQSIVPKFAYETILETGVIDSELEKIISRSAVYSVMYSENILQNPFTIGEHSISLNPRQSLRYARNVLKGRFIEGEFMIASQLSTAILYARHVLKGRFELAENLILTNRDVSNNDGIGDRTHLTSYFSILNMRDLGLEEKIKSLYLNDVKILELYFEIIENKCLHS
jgi:hypothetical protein